MGSTGDLLGVGTSALQVFQRALSTTGHNIANVNTDGYSRQSVSFNARPATPTGAGFIGSGVESSSIQRAFDDFLNNQVRTSNSAFTELDTYFSYAKQVDSLMADPNIGLSPGLDSFFNAVQDVADDPASMPARQVMLSEAQALTDRFDFLDRRLSELRNGSINATATMVEEINVLATAIASINEQIVVATGNSGGQPPNDLLDQRDQLVNDLSEIVSVSSVKQNNGSVNLFIGNGQTLVVGNISNTLTASTNTFDPTDVDISIATGIGNVAITNNINGGRLGGTLQFRQQILDPAMNELGRIAIALSDTFNGQHQLGMDLNGQLGGIFFGDINQAAVGIVGPQGFSSTANGGDATVAVTITDTNRLTTSDYQVAYNSGTDQYTVLRLSDNTSFGPFAGGGPAFPATIDLTAQEGISLTVSGTAISNGDLFLVKPTAMGANDINVALTSAAAIAAAAPIRTSEAVNANGIPTNTGSGSISPGSVNTPAPPNANLTQTVTITFNNPPSTFDVAGVGTGNPVGVGYTSGANITYNGWTMQISGTPAAGDSFVVALNASGTGDNRNALLLGDLSNQDLMDNGSTNYTEAYGQFIANVGTRTHHSEINRQAQSNLLVQSQQAQQQVSGVNLDQEAANLVRYQQAYQAAAQVIAVSNTLFDSLLGAFRR